MTYKNEEHIPFELLEDAWIWCPQHIVDLIDLVQLAGSREERVQTKTHMGIEPPLSHNKGISTTIVYYFLSLEAERISQSNTERKLNI